MLRVPAGHGTSGLQFRAGLSTLVMVHVSPIPSVEMRSTRGGIRPWTHRRDSKSSPSPPVADTGLITASGSRLLVFAFAIPFPCLQTWRFLLHSPGSNVTSKKPLPPSLRLSRLSAFDVLNVTFFYFLLVISCLRFSQSFPVSVSFGSAVFPDPDPVDVL